MEVVGVLEFVVRWLEWRAAEDRYSEATIGGYQSHLRGLVGSIEADVGRRAVLEDFDEAAVRRWIGEQKRRGCKPATIAVRIGAVAAFGRWLVEQGLVEVDPCARVPRPRVPRPVSRYVAPSVVSAALGRSDVRSQLVLLLAAQEGLRRSEIARLRVDRVDFEAGSMVIDGKGRRERRLPIVAEVDRVLRDWLADASRPDSVWVFPGRDRGHLGARRVGVLVQMATEGAASTHSFRHTAATEVWRASRDVRVVQAMLGHQSLETTSRYLGACVDELGVAMEGRVYGLPMAA